MASELQDANTPKTVTTLWDPAEHLHTEEDMAAFLKAVFEEGGPALVAAALGDIAKAKGRFSNRTALGTADKSGLQQQGSGPSRSRSGSGSGVVRRGRGTPCGGEPLAAALQRLPMALCGGYRQRRGTFRFPKTLP